MQTKNLVPMLVAQIAHIATNFKENWLSAKEEIQDVIDLYTATGLPALNSEDLYALFNDTENLMYQKLTGGENAHLTMGKGEDRSHLAINQTAAMSLINKPSGYDALLRGIEQCNKTCMAGFTPNMSWDVRFPANSIKDLFVIDNNGYLQFSEKVKKDIEEAGKVYAKTEKGQAVYKFLKMLSDAFFECGLDKFHYGHLPTINGEKIAGIVQEGIREIDIESKTFAPIISRSNSVFPNLYFDNAQQYL